MTVPRRYGLLVGGSLLSAASVICVVTPLLWALAGRSAESYPELGALAYLLPTGVVVLGAGVARVFARPPWKPYAERLFWAGTGAACTLWVLFFILLAGWAPRDPASLVTKGFGALAQTYYILLLGSATLAAIGWLVRKRA